MPIDQRRINGPEITVPYSVYLNLNKKYNDKKIKDILKTRDKSRKHNETRQMCKLIKYVIMNSD